MLTYTNWYYPTPTLYRIEMVFILLSAMFLKHFWPGWHEKRAKGERTQPPASLSTGEMRSCLVPAKFGECQGGFSLIRNTSAEQYMYEEDHIYISSRVFSAGAAVPNWPCGSVEEARSLVVRAVELSFPAGGPSGWEKGSHAAIIGAGDRRQETAWCQLTLICAVSCPICVIGKGKASLLRAVDFPLYQEASKLQVVG